MNCWHCQTELIWGGDHSVEELKPILAEEYAMVTNLDLCHGLDSKPLHKIHI